MTRCSRENWSSVLEMIGSLIIARAVWSPHHTNLINKIEKVQRSFTTKLYFMSSLSYKDRLASLKFNSLDTRRVKQDLVMCYKTVNGLICLDFSDFFSYVVSDRTRGHNYKLAIQNCRIDARKFCFARRVCPIWNKLPFDVVNAYSLNSFKRKLTVFGFDD